MSKRNDITTPEGYFENLQQRLSEIPARPVRVSPVHRLAPYAAIAASFLVAVLLGNAVLRRTAPVSDEDETWTYVSYLADALDPDGAAMMDFYDYYGEEEEQQGLSAEDIVNYLLADGISVEHLNYLSYEEGF